MPTTNTYLLTGFVYRRLRKLGYTLTCGKCNEPLLLGSTVVAYLAKRNAVKRLFHKACWEDLGDPQKSTLTSKEKFLPVLVGYQPRTPTPSIRLVKAYYKTNPGVMCSKKFCERLNRRCEFDPPQLLLPHHSSPDLSLWICARNASDFLIRAEKA